MALAVSQERNPNRMPREAFGLKAEATLNRITLNPSSINPAETLYVNIPKLAEGVVIVSNVQGCTCIQLIRPRSCKQHSC